MINPVQKPTAAIVIVYQDGTNEIVKEGFLVRPMGDKDVEANFLNLSPKKGLEMLKLVQDGLIKNIKYANAAEKTNMNYFTMDVELWEDED